MTFGTITNVEQRPLGSALIVDSLTGSTTLTVEMTSDFDEDGGQLSLAGVVLDYTAMDSDTGIITLAAPLIFDAVTDDPVLVVESGTVSVEWIANVATDEGDTIPATIPTSLIGYFPEGTPTTDTSVEVALRNGGTYEVTSQPQTTPSYDGAVVWNPYAFADVATDSAPNATYTQVTAWQARESNGVTAAAGYTIAYPGVYAVSAQIPFASNVNGRRRGRILLNGDTANPVLFRSVSPDPGVVDYVGFARDIRLKENDVLTLEVWQDSGATLTFGAAAGSGNFSLHRVSV